MKPYSLIYLPIFLLCLKGYGQLYTAQAIKIMVGTWVDYKTTFLNGRKAEPLKCKDTLILMESGAYKWINCDTTTYGTWKLGSQFGTFLSKINQKNDYALKLKPDKRDSTGKMSMDIAELTDKNISFVEYHVVGFEFFNNPRLANYKKLKKQIKK